MDPQNAYRSQLAPYRAALAAGDLAVARVALEAVAHPEAVFRLGHPLGTCVGAGGFAAGPLAALGAAWPDLERRDWLVVAGRDGEGACWIGCAGHYVGTFAHAWLDIPPTGHVAHMRFHEFYRFAGGELIEMQALWDVPEVMMQAGAWPMGPSLGREMCVPGPATCDGLAERRGDGEAARAHVVAMLEAMVRHPAQGGPEVMEMPRYWHPHFTWYGPAGIGTARGLRGFRDWHQIPFLAAMPDRGQHPQEATHHFFAEGDYVAVTGWPNMAQTLTGDGWLGIAPVGQKITLRSLDFWRLENGLIRENWVLVDLLDVFDQIGVDVLGRMREFNKARAGFDGDTGRAL